MWTLQALKRDYRIALIAGGRIDLPALNAFYGTSIAPEECETVEIALPWPLARADWGAAIRGALVGRGMRRHFDRFDVLINSYNIADFGRPGIHFLADFSWDEALRRSLDPPPPGPRKLLHVNTPLRRLYLMLSRAIAGSRPNKRPGSPGLVLANSNWSRDLLRRRHGIDSQVLYPPVAMRVEPPPRERKLDRFVCLGRISPEKRIERMVQVLRGVRARGHDVSLHIVGDTRQTAYGRKLERLCRAEGPWIVLEGGRFGEAKARLLAESAFGIHACRAEAFGIAVAEMISAGCIAFAPAEGGPAEILGHDALLYRNDEEAVEKICAVLRSPALRARLGEHLRRQAGKFSTGNFMRQIRATVEEFLRASYRERDTAGA